MKKTFHILFLFFCICFSQNYLNAAATIVGTVTDSITGLPISGALVEAFKGNQVRYSDTTDSNGSYALTNVQPSNYTLVISASGYQTQSVGVKPNNNQTKVVDIVLVPNGGNLEGTIRDAKTILGISGAVVRVFQGLTLIKTTTTDSHGFYSIPNLAPGNYIVLATASGYQGQFQGTSIQSNTTTVVDFALTLKPGIISGKVIDASNSNPIAGALVEVFSGSVLVGFSDTDSNGDYTIPNLAPGQYTVIASEEINYQIASLGATVNPNTITTVNFALQPNPGAITGTVTNAANGNIISGANVLVFDELTLVESILTDKNGNYTLTGLAPGNYTLVANATNFRIASAGATVNSNNTTIVNFALSPDFGSLSGTVTDASTNRPISGTKIEVHSHLVLVATAVTDANGKYSIPNLEPDTYFITAKVSGFQIQVKTATVNSQQNTVINFSLNTPPGTIAGKVISATTGSPIQGATIAAFIDDILIDFALTDMNGSYTIPNLMPGNYTVVALAKGYQADFTTTKVVANSTSIVDFVLGNNPGTISGTVSEECNAKPIQGIPVIVTSGSTLIGFDLTDDQGNYLIGNLSPGNYTVTIFKKQTILGSSQGIVKANKTTIVNFLIAVLPPANISGVVKKNKFLSQTDLIHKITWEASPSSCVKGYQVFRNGKKIAFVSSKRKLTYIDHNRHKRADIYTVKTVSDHHQVSEGISVKVGGRFPIDNKATTKTQRQKNSKKLAG